MALNSMRGEHLADSKVVLARDGDAAVRGFLHSSRPTDDLLCR